MKNNYNLIKYMSKNWEYFIHSTTANFIDILDSGYLLPKTDISNYRDDPLTPEPYVYTHLIFNGLPQDKNLYWHYFPNKNSNFIFVIDPIISKIYEMYVCEGMYYGHCVNNKNRLLLNTSGNLKKKIPLTKIKNFILEKLNYFLKLNHKKYSYLYTHEILFPLISMQYVKKILINKNYLNKKTIISVYKAINKYPNIKFTIYDSKEPNFDIYFNDIK